MPHSTGVEEPMQRALVDFIRRPTAGEEMRADPVTFFRAHGVNASDAQISSNPTVASRFQLYRELVLGRLKGALEVSIPRTLALIGPNRVDSELDAFLCTRGSRSTYLRDVAAEFVAFAEGRWRGDPDIPVFLSDLAKHELLAFEIAAAEDDTDLTPIGEVTVNTPLRFQGAARLAHYDYPVHLMPEEDVAPTAPEPGAFSVLAYRDESRQVRYLQLSALGAALLERAMDGEPLGSATSHGLADAGLLPSDENLTSIAILLEDLEHRGVLVGT